jgi:hypothetical protein
VNCLLRSRFQLLEHTRWKVNLEGGDQGVQVDRPVLSTASESVDATFATGRSLVRRQRLSHRFLSSGALKTDC